MYIVQINADMQIPTHQLNGSSTTELPFLVYTIPYYKVKYHVSIGRELNELCFLFSKLWPSLRKDVTLHK